MKALLYRDWTGLRRSRLASAMLILGCVPSLLALAAGGGAAMMIGGLIPMVMVALPLLAQAPVRDDRVEGILEAFRSSGRPMAQYVAEKLLIAVVPPSVFAAIVLAAASMPAGLSAAVWVSVMLAAVFASLGALASGGDAGIGSLIAVIVPVCLIGAQLALPGTVGVIATVVCVTIAAAVAVIEAIALHRRFAVTLR